MEDPPAPALLHVGWTTVEKREDAERLARGLVSARLAACVQIDGPVRSFYPWEGALAESDEYRLAIKFTPRRAAEVEVFIAQNHPYETPQWVAVAATSAGAAYVAWAEDATAP